MYLSLARPLQFHRSFKKQNHNQCRQLVWEETPVWFWGLVCTKRLAVLHSHTWYYNGMQHSTTTAETSTTGTTHGFSTSSTKISTTQIGGWWSVQCCCAMGRPSGSSSSQGDQFRGRRWPERRSPRRQRVQDVLQPHDSTQMSASSKTQKRPGNEALFMWNAIH